MNEQEGGRGPSSRGLDAHRDPGKGNVKEGGEQASPPGDKGRASEVVQRRRGSCGGVQPPGGQRVGRRGAGPGRDRVRGTGGGPRSPAEGPRGGRPGGAGGAGESQAHAADKERGWPGRRPVESPSRRAARTCDRGTRGPRGRSARPKPGPAALRALPHLVNGRPAPGLVDLLELLLHLHDSQGGRCASRSARRAVRRSRPPRALSPEARYQPHSRRYRRPSRRCYFMSTRQPEVRTAGRGLRPRGRGTNRRSGMSARTSAGRGRGRGRGSGRSPARRPAARAPASPPGSAQAWRAPVA